MRYFMILMLILSMLQACGTQEEEEILSIAETCTPVNPTVEATGDPSLPWVTPVSAGTRVSFVSFCSGAAQSEVSYHVYIPEVYESSPGRHFPVLYWLHGGGLGPGIDAIPFFSQYFDQAIRQGLIPPMLVVFPHSPVRPFNNQQIISMWVDDFAKKSPVETILMEELIPHVDANYRTISEKRGRALDGFSMGGYGAARLGFKFHEKFISVSMMGAGPMQERLENTPRMSPQGRAALLELIYGNSQTYFFEVSPRKMAADHAVYLKQDMHIRIVVGDADETFADNQAFHQYLESLAIPHAFLAAPGIPHNGSQLINFLGQSNYDYYTKVFGDL